MVDMTTPMLSWDVVSVEKPDDLNVIIGQAHFIKTVEDLHEALVGVSPSLRFGLAFCEASGPRLVRRSGNDHELVELAARNALAIAAAHTLDFLREGFPHVLNPIKGPELLDPLSTARPSVASGCDLPRAARDGVRGHLPCIVTREMDFDLPLPPLAGELRVEATVVQQLLSEIRRCRGPGERQRDQCVLREGLMRPGEPADRPPSTRRSRSNRPDVEAAQFVSSRYLTEDISPIACR